MTDRPRRRKVRFDSLEARRLLYAGFEPPLSTAIVYSDPTAPPEPHPGPYPGEDSPIGYPTPVPGGPVGPGFFGRLNRT